MDDEGVSMSGSILRT